VVALLLYIGFFKGASFMKWAPIDLTVIAITLVVGAVCLNLMARRAYIVIPLGVLVFVGLCIPPIFYAPTNPAAWDKRLRLAIPLIAAVGVVTLVDSPKRQRVWVWLHVIVGVLLVGTAVGATDPAGRFAGAGSNTIGAGRASGVAIVVLLVLLVTKGLRGRVPRMAASLTVVWLLFALIDTGSRGPLFSCAAAALIVSAVSLGRGKPRRVAVAVCAILTGWFVITGGTGLGARRIYGSVSGEYSLMRSRAVLWDQALHVIYSNPLGIGWGNFWSALSPGARLDSGYDQYPHNVILEIFVEAGWLTGLAFLVLVAVSFARLYAKSGSPYGAALLGIAVFFVLNAMVSGDVNDNRMMWAAVAIAWALGPRSTDVNEYFSAARREPPPRRVDRGITGHASRP
jgi:hypothetical protein